MALKRRITVRGREKSKRLTESLRRESETFKKLIAVQARINRELVRVNKEYKDVFEGRSNDGD